MHFESTSFTPQDARQDVLHTAFLIEQICLVVVVQIAVINLFSQIATALNLLLPAWLLQMPAASSGAALAAALALFCIEPNRSAMVRNLGRLFAGLTAVLGVAVLVAFIGPKVGHLGALGRISGIEGAFPAPALAFLMLGIVILFIRSRGPISGHLTDAAASGLAFLVLLLVLQLGFGTAGREGSSLVGLTSIPTLACLALLTVTIIIRRAEFGVFAVFLGGGIGGRVARFLAPILIVLPFLRELGRARLLHAQLLPASYSTALLASTATLVSFVLLVILTRIINRMQGDIQDLTLRDELSGLYNFRGFNLFAEQAFRLARRARIPFGVLFLDMDNLKTINDELGHNAGSACILEMAKLLNETLRETDVIGRLGGDEFVVAGQFDTDEIEGAIDRLRAGAAARRDSAQNLPISFSVGYAAAEQSAGETLKSIVARADQAMYREKRGKKALA